MSDCSTKAWKLQLENAKSYLDGFSKGIHDVEERLKHLRELEQRYQQLEQVAKEMLSVILASGNLGIALGEEIYHEYWMRLFNAGVSLDD